VTFPYSKVNNQLFDKDVMSKNLKKQMLALNTDLTTKGLKNNQNFATFSMDYKIDMTNRSPAKTSTGKGGVGLLGVSPSR
jgi:hypothetical protein